jgi:LytR cell envelope-related transcriptional attenuator
VEPRALRRTVLLVVIALAVLGAGGWGVQRWRHRPGRPIGSSGARAPEGVRIKVQVLNATRTRGLARRATMHLRDRGFDVVDVGTDPNGRDSVLVLDRSGHPEWAKLVARALGGGQVLSRPDSSRYLDVTVLLGGSWRPPAEPFYP